MLTMACIRYASTHNGHPCHPAAVAAVVLILCRLGCRRSRATLEAVATADQRRVSFLYTYMCKHLQMHTCHLDATEDNAVCPC